MTVRASWSTPGAGWAVVVQGGAGDAEPPNREGLERGCRLAAVAAGEVLRGGGMALDAVQRAVETLENDPAFNAGLGSTLSASGTQELDASIMEGGELRAGAVGSLRGFRNPIAVARAALESGEHVLYAGVGAEGFARQAGFTPVVESSMITAAARQRYVDALSAGRRDVWAGGTVGCVALDAGGAVAAATSTGGLAGKASGRVGDSAIIGAGTYADDRAGAASASGDGEAIIRCAMTALAVEALRSGVSAPVAAQESVEALRDRTGSPGGIVLLGRDGHVAVARSTALMPWAAMWQDAPAPASGS